MLQSMPNRLVSKIKRRFANLNNKLFTVLSTAEFEFKIPITKTKDVHTEVVLECR
jgi:hypothetical protein